MGKRKKVRVKREWCVKTALYQECPGIWVLQVSADQCAELHKKDRPRGERYAHNLSRGCD